MVFKQDLEASREKEKFILYILCLQLTFYARLRDYQKGKSSGTDFSAFDLGLLAAS